MRKNFPHYRQLDAMDCGPTCLWMIAKYYGRNYTLQSLREKSFITRVGVSMPVEYKKRLTPGPSPRERVGEREREESDLEPPLSPSAEGKKRLILKTQFSIKRRRYGTVVGAGELRKLF